MHRSRGQGSRFNRPPGGESGSPRLQAIKAIDAAHPSGYPQFGNAARELRVEGDGQTSIQGDQHATTPDAGRSRAATRNGRVHRALALADSLAIVIVLAFGLLVDDAVAFSSAPDHAGLVVIFALVAWLVTAGLDGLFHVDDRRIDCSTSDEMFRITRTVALWIWIVFGVDALLTAHGGPSVSEAIFIGVLAIPAILIARDLTRWLIRKQAWFSERVVIVGTDRDRERIRRTIVRHPEYGLTIVGETHAISDIEGRNDENRESVPDVGRLLGLVVAREADRVVFGSAYHPALEERTGALRFLAEHGVKVDLVPGDSDSLRMDAELHHIEGLPLVTLPSPNHPRYASAIKRGVDVAVAAGALLVLSPLLAACALAIRLNTPGPVFFRQPRVGRKRARFSVLKFRTMVRDAEDLKPELSELNRRNDGMFKIPEDPRVTRVGRWLRRYSLDELPQLVNVLRGEMSLVGPRPLIQVEADLVDVRYEARFNVRPGITGRWQVFGRSDIPFDEMIKLDYTYVTNWSVGQDIKLMTRTLSAMLAGRGAY